MQPSTQYWHWQRHSIQTTAKNNSKTNHFTLRKSNNCSACFIPASSRQCQFLCCSILFSLPIDGSNCITFQILFKILGKPLRTLIYNDAGITHGKNKNTNNKETYIGQQSWLKQLDRQYTVINYIPEVSKRYKNFTF